MTTASDDARWMRRALRLAEKGFAAPNPMVGCVIVKDGVVVGEGYHPYAGQPHAEVFALRAAGEQARGGTAYVTLEPCCHWGRTPPCTEALKSAGVARVVAATTDNDPRVGGRGLEILRAAGIEVTVGVRETEARRVNEAFFYYHSAHMPFVTLKAAMTLDGKIATRTGDSRWITGPKARNYVHLLRAQSGAVMVGIGTLLADNARLDVRLDPPTPRQPLRIIVDSRLRTPTDAEAVLLTEPPHSLPLLIATTEKADPERERKLLTPSRRGSLEILHLPAAQEGVVDLQALMRLLAERQIISVLAEGGGQLHAALLEAKLAQKALFFIAPKLVGGRNAPTPLEGEGIAAMQDAIALNTFTVRRFGPDIALEARLSSGSEASGV